MASRLGGRPLDLDLLALIQRWVGEVAAELSFVRRLFLPGKAGNGCLEATRGASSRLGKAFCPGELGSDGRLGPA